MADKYVALSAQKCEFIYLLARAINATTIVEAGTSFGVSTVYLGLAVGQNAGSKNSGGVKRGRVIATEKENSKASQARANWQEAGQEVEPFIELLEGDLLATLPPKLDDLGGKVDMLLLDSASYLSIFHLHSSILSLPPNMLFYPLLPFPSPA
jgi:predicted O-methyltransferase YrrM